MRRIFGLFVALQISFVPVAMGQTSDKDSKDPRGKFVPAADGGLGSTLTDEQLLATWGKYDQPKPPWKVSAAEEPKPVFRYQFWPRESELKPGSGQVYYFRALTKLLQRDRALATLREITSRENQTSAEDRAFITLMDPLFQDLKTMAYLEDMSWDHRSRDIEGPQLYFFDLDDIQGARDLARFLMVKARIYLADRDFENASQCVLIGNRLAYLIGQGESVIQRLVGCALQAMMRMIVEEMVQIPGCPNLYWAIATIPQPLVTIRRCVELELSAVHRAFPALREAATANWSDTEAEDRWIECLRQLRKLNGADGNADERDTLLAVDYSDFVPSARDRLKTAGVSEEQLEKMAAAAIVMADTAIELDRLIDESRKGLLLPGPQKDLLLQLNEAGFHDAIRFDSEPGGYGSKRSAVGLFAGPLFPAIRQLDAAADRTPIMYRRLMTMEAIRMYAAANEGKLPDSIENLKPLPAVFAFSTERPFEYRVDRNGDVVTATLSGKIPNFPTAEHLTFQIVP